jgi:SAM-dependent methyltransferase
MTNHTPQFSDLVGGIEDATRRSTGSPNLAQGVLLGFLHRYHPFTSVVDVGCGGGQWLRASLELGATRVQGFDLIPIDDNSLAVARDLITITDLSAPMTPSERFDLAVSTEVAEHIAQSCADKFIKNLCAFSDVVLFSAALPYQGGINHVNENWLEYWNRLFRSENFICFDIFRDLFWHDTRIPYFYRQNCVLYVHSKWCRNFENIGLRPTLEPRSLVHPELLLQAVNRARHPSERRFSTDAELLHRVAVDGREPSVEANYTYGQEQLWMDG